LCRFGLVEREAAVLQEHKAVQDLQDAVQNLPTIQRLKREGMMSPSNIGDLIIRPRAEGREQEASRIEDDLARYYRESGILKDFVSSKPTHRK